MTKDNIGDGGTYIVRETSIVVPEEALFIYRDNRLLIKTYNIPKDVGINPDKFEDILNGIKEEVNCPNDWTLDEFIKQKIKNPRLYDLTFEELKSTGILSTINKKNDVIDLGLKIEEALITEKTQQYIW